MAKSTQKRPAGKAGNGSGRNKTGAKKRLYAQKVRENAKSGLISDPTTGSWRQPQSDEEKKKAVMTAAGARADKTAAQCRPRHGGAVHWTPR